MRYIGVIVDMSRREGALARPREYFPPRFSRAIQRTRHLTGWVCVHVCGIGKILLFKNVNGQYIYIHIYISSINTAVAACSEGNKLGSFLLERPFLCPKTKLKWIAIMTRTNVLTRTPFIFAQTNRGVQKIQDSPASDRPLQYQRGVRSQGERYTLCLLFHVPISRVRHAKLRTVLLPHEIRRKFRDYFPFPPIVYGTQITSIASPLQARADCIVAALREVMDNSDLPPEVCHLSLCRNHTPSLNLRLQHEGSLRCMSSPPRSLRPYTKQGYPKTGSSYTPPCPCAPKS